MLVDYECEQDLGNGFKIVLYSGVDFEDFSNSKLIVLRGPANNPEKLEPIAGYAFKEGAIVAEGYGKDALAIVLMPFYFDRKIPDMTHALIRRLIAEACGYIKSREKQKEIINEKNISLHFEFSDDQIDAGVSAYCGGKLLFEYVAQKLDNKITYSNSFDLNAVASVVSNVGKNFKYPAQVRLIAQDMMCGLLPETQKDLEWKLENIRQVALLKAEKEQAAAEEKRGALEAEDDSDDADESSREGK